MEQRLAVRTREFVDRPSVGGEAADREDGTVDRDRWKDRTDPRPVGEASVDDRCGAIDAPADRREYPFEEMLDPLAVEVTGRRDRAATIDPDLTAGVDEHLVDRRVAEQHVEVAEPHEPGHGVLRESLLIVARVEREGLPDLEVDDRSDVAGARRGAGTDRGEHPLIVRRAVVRVVVVERRRHAATPRSSRPMGEGSRAASRPASTARAIAGSALTVATTGAPRQCSTSREPICRAGLVDQDHPGRPHGRTCRAAQRQIAGSGHEQHLVGRRDQDLVRCRGSTVDEDADPIVVLPSQPPGELAPLRVVDRVPGGCAVGATKGKEARGRVGVDDEFVQLIDMRVGTQPVVDARAVGVGHAEDGGEFAVEVDEQRMAPEVRARERP